MIALCTQRTVTRRHLERAIDHAHWRQEERLLQRLGFLDRISPHPANSLGEQQSARIKMMKHQLHNLVLAADDLPRRRHAEMCLAGEREEVRSSEGERGKK